MTNQNDKFRFMERILHLLHILEEKHLEIEQVFESGLPSGLLSAEEETELQVALECIRFMDEIPGGFFIYYAEEDERLIYANHGVLRMFLCDTMQEFRELTGNSFRGIVHPDDLEMVESSIHKQISSSQHDLDYVEYRIRRKDGSIRWVDDYGHLIRSSTAGDVFCVFLGEPSERWVLRQTQQMQQMQALAETFEKTDLTVKAKNEFLAQISHEMRTPLNAIFGFTTLARFSLHEPEEIANYLEQIETASHQLLNMITQALEISALSGSTPSNEEECNLRAILQEVYDSLQPQAKEKKLTFNLDCKNLTHPYVYTVSKWLRQLVSNLTQNAITYTETGGTVEVVLKEEKSLTDAASVYRLEVRDNGIGMAPSYLEHMYEPFSRERNSTHSGIHGIGLGLTIVHSIVNLLGGTISVKSAPGEGSTFTVTLSFQMKSDASAASEAPPLHILLAEDNEINRIIEAEILERSGFVVDAVSGGNAALEKVKNASSADYDLILTDLQMPDMNGWEVASAIRNLPDPALAHIPIIALSANVQPEDRRKSLKSGIDVHLPKPMDFNLLLETIKKITAKN